MTWTPPPLLDARDPDRIRGALYGSQLFDQPEHANDRDAILSFLQTGEVQSPVALEIGFDHGMVILDHARRFPHIRWLGLEIRKKRVEAAARHAPDNCRLVRADARTVLAALIPRNTLDFIYILFPTPTEDPRHLLLTPQTVEHLRRALKPNGQLHLATDVEGLFYWAEQLFTDWLPGTGLPFGPVLSRRDRVCRRDGLSVWRATWRCPQEAGDASTPTSPHTAEQG